MRYDSATVLNLSDHKNLCFTPSVNNFFTFADDQMYQDFKKAVFQSMCGKDDKCPSGSDIHKVGQMRLFLNKIPVEKDEDRYPTTYIEPQDFIYDDGTEMKLSADSITSLGPNMKELFTTFCGVSNPGKDQKISLALGRQFFNKAGLALQVDIGINGDPDVYKIGLAFNGSPAAQWSTSGWSYLVILAGIASILALLAIVFKGKSYQEVSRNALAGYLGVSSESI